MKQHRKYQKSLNSSKNIKSFKKVVKMKRQRKYFKNLKSNKNMKSLKRKKSIEKV